MSEIRGGVTTEAPGPGIVNELNRAVGDAAPAETPATTACSSSWPGRWWKASATLVAGIADGSPQAERLEQMKREFLVAQQRRRDKSPHAVERNSPQ